MTVVDDPRYGQLKAEWLKLKGHLHDANTGLPALPAVIDDVRRRVEAGERLGLLYLDLSSEEALEEIYGWETYDKLLKQVADLLLRFRDSTLHARDVITLLGIRGDEFLIVVGTGGKRGQETTTLHAIRNQMMVELSVALRVQIGNDPPRALQLLNAAAILRYDPTQRIERSLYRCIDQMRAVCRREREQKHTLRLNELRRIVQHRDIRVRYQPIVRLADGRIHGFEALSCGPEGDIFESAEMLFTFAEGTDHIVDLERLCRAESLRGAHRLPGNYKLFLNCSVHAFSDPELVGAAIQDAVGVGVKPPDIVFEVTERVAVTAWRQFHETVIRLRRDGFGIAIDDTGAGYSSLQTVAEIQPDYLKLDISLVRDVHRSAIKRNLLETLIGFANNLGSSVVGEGIEKADEFHVLRDLGVPLGQGYFFAPPAPQPGLVYFPNISA